MSPGRATHAQVHGSPGPNASAGRAASAVAGPGD
jgi:hypothetical protein